ncbi:MAG: ATP-binding protein [Lachnospiraceae bacterium]|nr:ATP-binding protein [Lachnospiraceae bacterium]
MEFARTKKLNELISKENNHLIKIVTGIRRCGKSYLLDHIFKRYLLEKGVPESHIVGFAFDFGDDIDKLDSYFPEEETRIHVKGTKSDYVINAKKFRAYIKDQTRECGQYYLLLDEVQKLENFAETLNGFLRYENLDVYVTGSNSKFLSSDIATEFRGRGDVVALQPLTFKEIFDAFGGDKRDLMEDYLRYGGLPLCVLAAGNQNKENYLISAYETIYEKDILDRKRIRNTAEFRELAEIVSSSVGALTNPQKIASTFKSGENSTIQVSTVQRYLTYLEDAFILKTAKRYNIKGRKYIGAPCKYYFSDLGVRNAVIGFRQYEKTHLMENLLYNELLNRGYNVDVGVVEKYTLNQTGSYSRKNLEVDFVAGKGSQRYYIQSAYSIEDDIKKAQEERSLREIDDSFKKIIVVYDSVKPYYTDSGFLIIGLIDFLLDENSLQF